MAVGEVVAEPPLDHDAQRGQVGAVGREGVRGQEPAALAEGVRDVEHRVIVDRGIELEGEHGQLVAACQELERAELLDLLRQPRRDLARVALHLGEAVEAEAQEVVILRDDLRARAARS